MSTLLDAVDDLTKPVTDHIAQKSDTGKWLKAHTVTHAPLLQRMADAVMPSGANRANGAPAAPNTRSLIDLEALFEFRKMVAAIGVWCRMVNVMPARNPADPVADLRRWYVAALTKPDMYEPFYIKQMTSWAHLIRNKIDPPSSFVADGNCPVCGGGSWGDAINGGDMWPIVIKYRLDDDDRMTDETAQCRLCRVVWEGHASISELAEEIKERKSSA